MGFYENLYRALRYGEKLSVPAEEGLNVIRIIEAAKESSESNRVVEI
jgi:predicted dehydrogenase